MDLDPQLLREFSSMGTDDKEVLISQFQKLLGNQLSSQECDFFLDMNNWYVISANLGSHLTAIHRIFWACNVSLSQWHFNG